MGCSPSILSSLSNNNNRKDSGLYCSNNNSDNNISNKIDAHNDTNTSTALANQILIQSSTKDTLEKVNWMTINCWLAQFNQSQLLINFLS